MNPHDRLDEFKRQAAMAVLERADITTIRECGLANLDRWIAQGVWVSAFDEWRALLASGSDDAIAHTMTSRDEKSNRLRQSAPYAGMLDETTRQQIWTAYRNWEKES